MAIPKTSAANDNMSFGRREANNSDARLGFEHGVAWKTGRSMQPGGGGGKSLKLKASVIRGRRCGTWPAF
jgi:hypothetical protein